MVQHLFSYAKAVEVTILISKDKILSDWSSWIAESRCCKRKRCCQAQPSLRSITIVIRSTCNSRSETSLLIALSKITFVWWAYRSKKYPKTTTRLRRLASAKVQCLELANPMMAPTISKSTTKGCWDASSRYFTRRGWNTSAFCLEASRNAIGSSRIKTCR